MSPRPHLAALSIRFWHGPNLALPLGFSPPSDYKAGFGGRFSVQSEKQDSCAVGFDYKERPAKHESQQGTVAPRACATPPHPMPPASAVLLALT